VTLVTDDGRESYVTQGEFIRRMASLVWLLGWVYTFAAQIGAQRGVLDHDLLALANKKASLLKLS